MTKKCRVVIYTDGVVFGGHEMTLLDAIIGLIESGSFEIILVVSEKNERFIHKLANLEPDIAIVKTHHHTEAGDIFRVILKTKKVKSTAQIIKQCNPDVVIISQGAIALSACGLGAKNEIDAKVISFLPMAHPVALTRQANSLTCALQDFLYRQLYALPDYFFTICNSTAEQLCKYHHIDREKIFVTYFGVDTAQVPEICYKFEANNETPKHVGIIGRIEFYQKRHDFFFRELAGDNLRESIITYVIGDGPDLEVCEILTEELGLNDRVRFTGWLDDVRGCFKKLDAIVLPSRFEGLPIVLLEAMYYGVPIVGSCVDGMKELLPEPWLFNEGDGPGMIKTMKRVLYEDQMNLVMHNQNVVINNLNRDKYKKNFSDNLQHICSTKSRSSR